jgi:DNA-binding transcriptional regulator YiaG
VRLAAALPAETFPTPLATRSGPGYHAEEWDLRRLEHRAHLARYLWSLRLVRSAARQEPTIVTASDAAVAARIREVRRARVLTQEELAERLGVPQSAVARWESGRVAGIRPRTIRKLAGALGVEPEALTGGVPAALAQRYANA